MKITASKLFDTDAVTKALQAANIMGLEDFISNLSDISDQLIRALKGKISLIDNIDCVEKVVQLSSGTSLTIANPVDGRKVRHMMITRVSDFSNPHLSFVWQYISTGDLEVQAVFKTPAVKNTVTLLMFY